MAGLGEPQHGVNVPSVKKGMCADREESVRNPGSRNWSAGEEPRREAGVSRDESHAPG